MAINYEIRNPQCSDKVEMKVLRMSQVAKKSGKKMREKQSAIGSIDVVSMFAGCGGLDLGFVGGFKYMGRTYGRCGYRIVKAFDFDSKAVETYRHNIGSEIEHADLRAMPAADIPAAQMLIGGFPCQEFSSCGPQGGLESERGKLYLSLVRYMEHHSPLIVVAENVINLDRMQDGNVLRTILADLESAGCGYKFRVWRLFAPDFGVPQFRHRLFLVGVRSDLPGHPKEPTPNFQGKHRSIDWAIADLEDICDESVPNQSQYFLASKAKRGNGQGDETNRAGEPSYCIRANPKSRVHFHYKLNRRLTVRECARLQTFPDDFVFLHSNTANIMQIGNAVPPILGHAVAKSVWDYLDNSDLLPFISSVNGCEAQRLLFG